MKRLLTRWQNGYNWRHEEKKINEDLPQFTTDIEIDGFGKLNVHFVHKRSTVEDAIPLLFSHGWPGSFLEVRKILPLLVDGNYSYPSFHVVALSLPGFGFSQGPSKKNFKRPQYAELINKLMLSLGYPEYVAQGGDWGQMVTRSVAELYGGKHVKAWHTNMAYVRAPKMGQNPYWWALDQITPKSEREIKGLAITEDFMKTGAGYMDIQSTRPQTIGYAMADSPAGLLSWIYEKLVTWSDNYPWTDDEVLTWVSIYWFSRDGPAASLRIYHEFEDSSELPALKVPSGASYFPADVLQYPKLWFRASTTTSVFQAEHSKGGHFAAHEQPDLLVGDLRKMFGKGGPAYGVVQGRNGYAKP